MDVSSTVMFQVKATAEAYCNHVNVCQNYVSWKSALLVYSWKAAMLTTRSICTKHQQLGCQSANHGSYLANHLLT